MKRIIFIPLLLLYFSIQMVGQKNESIRGVVFDRSSSEPIAYANVVVLNSPLPIGAATDSTGNFRLTGLSVGRYTIQVTYVGYEPFIAREITVSSGKETRLEIYLKENAWQLDETIIRPQVNKELPLNETALASARMFSVEEANRYAGGLDDPARLVSSFAGVAGNVSSNGITVRGNSPQYLQWKLEGIEIPNPTHFPDLTGVGGGIVTALSSQVLGNSDFLTGAFPAEYSNALSGVFDMKLRNGNSQQHEHTIQVGTMGIDFASEGPLKKGGPASFLFNYRYSSMALIDRLIPGGLGEAGGLRYQDLSFKIHLPTKSTGIFNLWGIGAYDNYLGEISTDSTRWITRDDRIHNEARQYMGALGMGHKFFFGKKMYLQSNLAVTFRGSDLFSKHMETNHQFVDDFRIKEHNMDLIFTSYLNRKFSVKHTNKTGITIKGLFYQLDYNMRYPYQTELQNFAKSDGSTMLLEAFSNSTVELTRTITANVGLNGNVFKLNRHWSIEPRAGLKWQVNTRQSFALAYGLHSRHEKIDYYFIKSADNQLINKDLDFTKAHHLVLGYDRQLLSHMHLKVEPYIQYLYQVPVISDSSFSLINHRFAVLNAPLLNDGKGLNYGVDLTLERYMNDGYYYMFTASVFELRYSGGDGVWRNTRLNRTFLLNILGGKEWLVHKHHVLGVNLRFSLMGGERYSPIHPDASPETMADRDPLYDESRAFTLQQPPGFISNITLTYKINLKKTAHEFAVKVLNANGYKEFLGYTYNYHTHQMQQVKEAYVMPSISYKVDF